MVSNNYLFIAQASSTRLQTVPPPSLTTESAASTLTSTSLTTLAPGETIPYSAENISSPLIASVPPSETSFMAFISPTFEAGLVNPNSIISRPDRSIPAGSGHRRSTSATFIELQPMNPSTSPDSRYVPIPLTPPDGGQNPAILEEIEDPASYFDNYSSTSRGHSRQRQWTAIIFLVGFAWSVALVAVITAILLSITCL